MWAKCAVSSRRVADKRQPICKACVHMIPIAYHCSLFATAFSIDSMLTHAHQYNLMKIFTILCVPFFALKNTTTQLKHVKFLNYYSPFCTS